MMLTSDAPTRDFSANPLASPTIPGQGKALGRGHPVRRRTRTRTGWSDREIALAGLGMTQAEAIAEIAAGAGPGTEAYEAYYGSRGYYSQAPSVVEAAREDRAEAVMGAAPGDMPAPMLYAALPCTNPTGECVSQNQMVQAANLALMENARRAYNLQVCEYNAALNPGTSVDQPCGQFRVAVPVPAVPGGQLQQAVCNGGECYTPYVGQTPTTPTTAVNTAVVTQRQASTITNQPNQTVPPRPQPGEVVARTPTPTPTSAPPPAQTPVPTPTPTPTPTGGGEKQEEDDGKILGMEPWMLAVAAGVALLVLRK